MKSIKFNHDLAQQILSGKVSSTWRIYDDKNIVVDDHIQLVDKVDPQDPITWQVFGSARVDQVIEKRIQDLVPADYDGHASYSTNEILEKLRHDHGPQVTSLTPIKLIKFTLRPTENVVYNTPKIAEAKLYADGGSRGNPGPSASAYAIADMNDVIVVTNTTYIGVTTNNQAEYQALKFGLEEALRRDVRQLHVFMDSLLVVNQMRGKFKVRNRDLWPIHDSILDLSKSFARITYTHIPRELNKIADAAVNQALDLAAAEQ